MIIWIIVFIVFLVIYEMINESSKSHNKKTNEESSENDDFINTARLERKARREALLNKSTIEVDHLENKNFDFHSEIVLAEPEPEPEPDINLNNLIFMFNRYDVQSLWHMTHKDNISTILSNGLLSNRLAHNEFTPKDISNSSVQKWRKNLDPYFNRAINEYAPLYVNIKNPMLYAKKDIQKDLCLIEISLSALSGKDFLFTDGNAASKKTCFFKDADDLTKLPWNVLHSNYWNDFDDGRRKKCAEVLVYPSIDPKYISRVHCNNTETLDFLNKIGCNALINKNLFFQ